MKEANDHTECWALNKQGECQICGCGEGDKVVCSDCINRWDQALLQRPMPEFVKNWNKRDV